MKLVKRLFQFLGVAFLLTLAYCLVYVWLHKDFVGVETDYKGKSALLKTPPRRWPRRSP